MSDDAHSPVGTWSRESACVHLLEDACVVRVHGDDARNWLNGQTTNDVREVGEDEAVYALSLDAKGRIQADLWVVAEREGMAFVTPASRVDALIAAMDRYIIMDDVELEPDPELRVITVQGPRAQQVLQSAPDGLRRHATGRLGAGGFDLWVPQGACAATLHALTETARALGGGQADAEAWAEAHVQLGVPRFGADFDARVYPQEAGLKQGVVSFDKGCYLGQEVVCMLENRGKLARRLVQLQGPADAAVAAGDPIHTPDGARVGEITSVARKDAVWALALVKSAQAGEGNLVRVGEADFRVTVPAGRPA